MTSLKHLPLAITTDTSEYLDKIVRKSTQSRKTYQSILFSDYFT